MLNYLFILHNIYETKSGVSNKYINFINFLKSKSLNVKLITTNVNNKLKENDINTIYVKGIKIPFYENIKIPNINVNLLKNIINNDHYIIIFNGEFFWLYNILINIKNKNKTIKLLPTWHTDYEKYIKNYINENFNIDYMMKILKNNLKNGIFDGIIVTGENTKKKFNDHTKNIFNANELCIENFNYFKIDNYKNEINFIYCGRVSKEKNLDFTLNLLNIIKNINFKFHIIGDGPYLDFIKNTNYNFEIVFYGELNSKEILNLYKKINNRIFLMTSDSETFGKAPMEAGLTGIPIFIKNNEITKSLYNNKNSFIFDDEIDFINNLVCFLKMEKYSIKNILYESYDNIKKYDQNIIFNEWLEFLNKNFISKTINNNKWLNPSYYLLNFFKCSIDVIND